MLVAWKTNFWDVWLISIQARGRRKCRSPQQALDPWTPRREDSRGSEPESWGDFRSLTDAPIARLESLDEMESLPVSAWKTDVDKLYQSPFIPAPSITPRYISFFKKKRITYFVIIINCFCNSVFCLPFVPLIFNL